MADWFPSYAQAWDAMQGLGNTGVPADWAPQPAQVTVNPADTDLSDVGSAYAQGGGGEAPPPEGGGGLGGIFSGLSSYLGGGAGAAAPAAGAAPGWQQGAIGLGLGLLAGNPFNKWGAAVQGYQRGAAADVARQEMTNRYAYQQQQLRQARDIAFRPQVHFAENPLTQEIEAFTFSPGTGAVRKVSIGDADKLAGQAGVAATVPGLYPGDPPIQIPYGVNARQFRSHIDSIRADIATGRETRDQSIARTDAARMAAAQSELVKGNLDHQGLSKWDVIGAGAGQLGKVGEKIGAAVMPQEYNKYSTARATFLDAMMARYPRENRADLERTYFPQPGETAKDVVAKRSARENAIRDIQSGAAPAYRPSPQAPPRDVAPRQTVKRGDQSYYQDSSGRWFDTWPPK